MAEALKTELETYEANKPQLLADEGKFVLIHGRNVLGVFSAYEDALRAGYEKCKLEPFLVKRIQAVEHANYVSRDLQLACPTSPSR